MIALTNSPIVLPSEDVQYKVIKISEDTAFGILDEDGFTSVLGHQGTVDALKEIFPGLKGSIFLNRVEIKEPTDQVVFKLKGRLPEGKILSLDEIKAVGYEFWSVSPVKKTIPPSDAYVAKDSVKC